MSMNNNKKRSTFFRCIKMAFGIMPRHFSAMLLIHIILAFLPLLGMQQSRKIYHFAQMSLSSFLPAIKIAFPFFIYTCYLLLMKVYVVYYQRVAVQFGGLLEFEKKAKLMLHKKCDHINMNLYETPSFYNSLWEAKVASINIYRLVECAISLLCVSINILLMSGYAGTIHPSFFAFVVLTAVPALVEKVFAAILRNRRRSELTQLSKVERARRECLTGISYAKERLVYNSFPFLFKKWKDAAISLLDKDYMVSKQVLRMGTVLNTIKAASTAGIYILAVWLFSKNKIDFADFMIAISTTLHLQTQYAELFSDVGYFSEFQMMVKPYFRFMDMDIDIVASTPNSSESIKFNNVGFSYPTSSKAVLHSLNFGINSGEKVAIVGLNGAGKTTISKLLAGLLHPTSGTIDGQLLSSCVMFQDYQKYELTLKENIAINETIPSMPEKIDQLINEMGIGDIPDGIILGREFGKTDLSGGQWQKVAMARLYYHGGKTLVLDEPTSSIDPIYEKGLNDLILEKANNGKTLVVISHRLSIAKLVDRIFVLENGTIVEQGSHKMLIRDSGSHYAKLWAAQTSWYE